MHKLKVFYNEIDQFCCAWMSNLMDAGQITPGVINDRSIEELTPEDVKGYDRAHFFAGIACWDYALNQAGWKDGRGSIWTGSCPCQPFSSAGKREGTNDKRHLWPEWMRLIRACKPKVVFGEQVDAVCRGEVGEEESLPLVWGREALFGVLYQLKRETPHRLQRVLQEAQIG